MAKQKVSKGEKRERDKERERERWGERQIERGWQWEGGSLSRHFNGLRFIEKANGNVNCVRTGHCHMSHVLRLSHCQAGHGPTSSPENLLVTVCVCVCEATGHARHHKNVNCKQLWRGRQKPKRNFAHNDILCSALVCVYTALYVCVCVRCVLVKRT